MILIRQYIATIKMSLNEQGYFGFVYLLGEYMLSFVRVMALILIWRSLMAQGHGAEGFTLSQMLTYTLISGVFERQLDIRTPAGEWCYSGSIITHLKQPLGIFSQLAARTIGRWMLPMLFCSLPMLMLAPIFDISLAPVTAWFAPSLLLTILLGFAVDFIFACLTMRFTSNSWSISMIRTAMASLLSGSLIPFAALPAGIGNVLKYLPMGSLAGAPLAIFVGLENPMVIIPVQLLWNALLWPAAFVLFKKGRERMVSYGG